MSHHTGGPKRFAVSVTLFFAMILVFHFVTEQSGRRETETSSFVHRADQNDDNRLPDSAARITPAQAKALAVNHLEQTADGIHLRHSRHEADFTADGLHFQTRRSNMDWHWQLTAIETAAGELSTVTQGPVTPEMASTSSHTVRYDRGGVVEQYVARTNTIEQQFVISEPLDLGGNDLVIRGSVTSGGRFEQIATPDSETRWQWRAGMGVISLGDVTVFDAIGAELPATMQVTANETRIEVDGLALAMAAYPVTIDPEIGANDFRISDMGPDSDATFDAGEPAVAYNSTDNEYLVVWEGDDDTASLVDEEDEIFGQRIDAATGDEIGDNDFRISDMGTDGSTAFRAADPAVAYNSADNEYLVVWEGDDNTAPLVQFEREIFGQRITAATGAEIGANDFRISDMGTDGSTAFSASDPAVAYNSTNNEYLVVWEGDDNTAPLVDGEDEIFGQRITAATGAEVGANDFRISDMGTNGSTSFSAGDPAVWSLDII